MQTGAALPTRATRSPTLFYSLGASNSLRVNEMGGTAVAAVARSTQAPDVVEISPWGQWLAQLAGQWQDAQPRFDRVAMEHWVHDQASRNPLPGPSRPPIFAVLSGL